MATTVTTCPVTATAAAMITTGTTVPEGKPTVTMEVSGETAGEIADRAMIIAAGTTGPAPTVAPAITGETAGETGGKTGRIAAENTLEAMIVAGMPEGGMPARPGRVTVGTGIQSEIAAEGGVRAARDSDLDSRQSRARSRSLLEAGSCNLSR